MIKPTRQGVAILYAILLVSIVLTVGLTLLNITLRQLVLSSLARESQFAFYASDSARGCARHYDSLGAASPFGYFDFVTNTFQFVPPDVVSSLDCGEGTVTVSTPTVASQAPSISDFTAVFTDGAGEKQTCAVVTVIKYQNPPAHPETRFLGKTEIVVRGYNNVDPSWAPGSAAPCYQNTERTVERAATMLY